MCMRTIPTPKPFLSVIGWNTVCYVSWRGLTQLVFVAICEAWGVYRDRVFLKCVQGTGSSQIVRRCLLYVHVHMYNPYIVWVMGLGEGKQLMSP